MRMVDRQLRKTKLERAEVNGALDSANNSQVGLKTLTYEINSWDAQTYTKVAKAEFGVHN